MGYRNIILLVCAGTIMGLQHASYQELPGSKGINQYIYIYIIPHQNGCHFNTFHISLSGRNSWSTVWVKQSPQKSQGTSRSQHPPKNTNPSHLYLGTGTTKDSSTANSWYVLGTRLVLVAKKTHTNWIRHPKWFTLDPKWCSLEIKMPKQVVGMLQYQYYLWDDDALPTSFDNPTCLEPSSHWATHSFEMGHCYCWSESKGGPTNINTRWRHVAILWTRHPQLNLKSHCETYKQIIPNKLFVYSTYLNATTWNKSLSTHQHQMLG